MAVSEYATMADGELEVRLVESRKELFNLRFQMATGQLDNTARIGHVKKEVARILTYLRQRDVELDEAEYAAALAVEHEREVAERKVAEQQAQAAAVPAVVADAADDEIEEEA
jgi:large subunit ribosomal protein L29